MPNQNDPTNNAPVPSTAPPPVVTDNIKLLFDKLTAPESQVVYSVDPRPTISDINGGVDQNGKAIPGSVDSFELRTGPSDLDSYHDFYRLEMAFEDVWMELTADPAIYQRWNALMDATLGTQRTLDRAKLFTTVADDGSVSYSDGTPVLTPKGQQLTIADISGAEDLQNFIGFLRQQFGLEAGYIPPAYSNLAAIVQNLANVCADLFNQVDRLGGAANTFNWNPNLGANVNDGAWPDDMLGTSNQGTVNGQPKPEIPFTSVVNQSNGMSRYQYLSTVIANINELVVSLKSVPDTSATNIRNLLAELDQFLREAYVFDVFAPNSVNYGLLINYRQHWTPVAYQVGNLVSTIPLAPQEVRRYNTKTVVKKSRNVKEMEASLRAGKEELSDTTRVDHEIVTRAKNSSNFQQNASGSFGNDNLYKVSAGMAQQQDQSVESAQTRRDFHEAVSKAAQVYRSEHRMEVTTDESREDEATNYREIRNPNDELTVTYLFYELQRRYKVEESLNKITPVILVANDVPSPHEVDEAWLLRHDWILKRTILDDSFLAALEYLSSNYTGTEVQLEVLKLEVEHQRTIVDQIAQQVSQANEALNIATSGLVAAESQDVADLQAAESFSIVKSMFDPLGITKTGSSDGNADRARVDFAKDALERAQTKVNQLVNQLKTETTALQIAIDKYVKASKEHYDKLADIDRLRIHVKDNILYYMQAIWTYEPPDQRYFRLYDIDVPVFSHNSTVTAQLDQSSRALFDMALDKSKIRMIISDFSPPLIQDATLKLHQVADIDSLLGFKGNYMIFPVVNFNYMNWFMMKDYLNFTVDASQPGGGSVQAKDPDPLADLSLSELQTAYNEIVARNPESFTQNEDKFKEIMLRLMENENDEIIVPSNSLYIEALPGTHPLLEDFKLIHRAVDVKKAQAEARHAELENLRLAARLSNSELGDPDIDKVVVVGTGQSVTVDAGQ
jgi:hypothetical protein